MLRFAQFKDLTERTLKEMGAYSDEATKAIMMIVAHESRGGSYIRQVAGPALGVIQMEPATHESLWDHADNIRHNARKLDIKKNVDALEWDLRYNIFMARSMLLTDPNRLPSGTGAMSAYLKRFYNTEKGKAGVYDYKLAYEDWKFTQNLTTR